ncbi:hypothetical protein [Sinomonas sp. R1AF57]|jgi:hypothetical protein|uniref:hypothetical protein n=1 Tax=Sinomonas sp. R1AF57 TaxID=2020377 RepID=UPI002100A97A|nr:hypothetical protein [Sinomonas sp. R1AF57]
MDIAANGADGQWKLTRKAMDEAGLKIGDVWLRYFSLSGAAGEYELEAYLSGLVTLPPIQRDLVSHAVNELIDERPPPRKAPYSDELGEGRQQ